MIIMKNIYRLLITILLLTFLIIVFYFITRSITIHTGFFISDNSNKENDFLACLNEKKMLIFINSEDSSGSLQRLRIYEYLDKFEIYNCARNNNLCLLENIDYFPTFLIENKKIEGDMDVIVLSEMTKCNR